MKICLQPVPYLQMYFNRCCSLWRDDSRDEAMSFNNSSINSDFCIAFNNSYMFSYSWTRNDFASSWR